MSKLMKLNNADENLLNDIYRHIENKFEGLKEKIFLIYQRLLIINLITKY